MTTVVALISLALFVICFRLAKILPVATKAISRARTATAILSDRSKTDDEKEKAARDTSIVLFGSFLSITALTVLALVPSIACLGLAVWAGFASAPELMAALVSLPLIAAAVLLFAIDYMVRR